MISFTLPWPHRALSQNARVHWTRRAKHTAKARSDAYLLTLMVMRNRSALTWPKVALHLAFAPPNRIKRDGHNLAASMKGSIDGISDALGIDDSRFCVSHELLEDIAGEVRVTLREKT
jgi:crossover junction endodeoxyribonuclease RusA